MTLALLALAAKVLRPAIKSASLIFSVEAIKPPTLTLDVPVNSTPLELSKNTCPLAFIAPAMTDCSVPITRFKITEDALGCTKLTVAPLPTEKLCQLTAARWLLWLTVRVLAVLLILAAPAVTWPPVGKSFIPLAQAEAVQLAIKTEAISAGVLVVLLPDLPRPLAVSATAVMDWVWWFQTMR